MYMMCQEWRVYGNSNVYCCAMRHFFYIDGEIEIQSYSKDQLKLG